MPGSDGLTAAVPATDDASPMPTAPPKHVSSAGDPAAARDALGGTPLTVRIGYAGLTLGWRPPPELLPTPVPRPGSPFDVTVNTINRSAARKD